MLQSDWRHCRFPFFNQEPVPQEPVNLQQQQQPQQPQQPPQQQQQQQQHNNGHHRIGGIGIGVGGGIGIGIGREPGGGGRAATLDIVGRIAAAHNRLPQQVVLQPSQRLADPQQWSPAARARHPAGLRAVRYSFSNAPRRNNVLWVKPDRTGTRRPLFDGDDKKKKKKPK